MTKNIRKTAGRYLFLACYIMFAGYSYAAGPIWQDYWDGRFMGTYPSEEQKRFKLFAEIYQRTDRNDIGQEISYRSKKKPRNHYISNINFKLNSSQWVNAGLHRRSWAFGIELPSMTDLELISTEIKYAPQGVVLHNIEVKKGIVVGAKDTAVRSPGAVLDIAVDKGASVNWVTMECNSTQEKGSVSSSKLYLLQNTISSPTGNTLLADLSFERPVYNTSANIFANFRRQELSEVVKFRLVCTTSLNQVWESDYIFDYSKIP